MGRSIKPSSPRQQLAETQQIWVNKLGSRLRPKFGPLVCRLTWLSHGSGSHNRWPTQYWNKGGSTRDHNQHNENKDIGGLPTLTLKADVAAE
ncbi:hypothetical protein V6N13_088952 [Hibiscus sabdariffa]|uniref:Uncharacterized protein n=1 Tax=Hibiscus sabdariffa TaxID=183260 RepID=A0ABR2G0W3_9ROSI